ncbi:MAG: glycosyltransferase [Candidatus Woesearchaeota archaeon]
MRLYYTPYSQTGMTGAGLYYEQISELLKKTAQPFNPLQTPEGDIVSTIGPFAQIFFYNRLIKKQNFRIVRDVLTAFYAGYILQEGLCLYDTREHDRIIFPSEYCRQVFLKLFPHRYNEIFVCHPIISSLPTKIERRKRSKELTIGYLGRLCMDKNFDQCLEVFVEVYKRLNGKARFIVHGNSSPEFTPQKVRKFLKEKGVAPLKYFHETSTLPYHKALSMLNKIDVLLFLSTSTHESLGRVILEANHFGVPVVAAMHGAAPEVLPKSNLVAVRYYKKEYPLDNVFSLGRVDVDTVVEKCLDYENLKIGSNKAYEGHEDKFRRIVNGESIKEKHAKISEPVRRFLARTSVTLNYDYRFNFESASRVTIDYLKKFFKKNRFGDIPKISAGLTKHLNYIPILSIK